MSDNFGGIFLTHTVRVVVTRLAVVKTVEDLILFTDSQFIRCCHDATQTSDTQPYLT